MGACWPLSSFSPPRTLFLPSDAFLFCGWIEPVRPSSAMIVVANLRLSGFFAVVSAWVVDHAHAPLVMISGIVLVSGVFSAFFVNDTMCLVLTPLVLDITRRLGRKPIGTSPLVQA